MSLVIFFLMYKSCSSASVASGADATARIIEVISWLLTTVALENLESGIQ